MNHVLDLMFQKKTQCVLVSDQNKIVTNEVGDFKAPSVNPRKNCPACGFFDHQRRSSKKCPFFKVNPKKVTANAHKQIPVSITTA